MKSLFPFVSLFYERSLGIIKGYIYDSTRTSVAFPDQGNGRDQHNCVISSSFITVVTKLPLNDKARGSDCLKRCVIAKQLSLHRTMRVENKNQGGFPCFTSIL